MSLKNSQSTKERHTHRQSVLKQYDKTIIRVCKGIGDGAGSLRAIAQERLTYSEIWAGTLKDEHKFARWIGVCRKAFITGRGHCIWQATEE